MNGRPVQPKYVLFICNKEREKDKTRAGVAFVNDFGGLNLKLHPGIVIRWNDEVYLNLNPYESKQAYARRMRHVEEDPPLLGDPPGGDELEEVLDEEYFMDVPEDV
jgi:hypothetical protein